MTLVWMCFEDDVTCTHALEGGGRVGWGFNDVGLDVLRR